MIVIVSRIKLKHVDVTLFIMIIITFIIVMILNRSVPFISVTPVAIKEGEWPTPVFSVLEYGTYIAVLATSLRRGGHGTS